MTIRKQNQFGFGALGFFVALIVVTAIGLVGYNAWQRSMQAKPNSNVTIAPATASTVPTAITSKADLTQAGQVLDTSNSQLDSSLNSSGLNTDINNLL